MELLLLHCGVTRQLLRSRYISAGQWVIDVPRTRMLPCRLFGTKPTGHHCIPLRGQSINRRHAYLAFAPRRCQRAGSDGVEHSANPPSDSRGLGDNFGAAAYNHIPSPEPVTPGPDVPEPVQNGLQRTPIAPGGTDGTDLQQALCRLQALEQYGEELQKPQIDIFKCALLIAKSAYPSLDISACNTQIEELARRVEDQLSEARYPMRVLQTVNKVLYEECGFQGNKTEYYEPENSYLNMVLRRRTGIPITLSLVYMEVARRVGLPMLGVNLPAHFMIMPDMADMEVLIDPFNGGDLCYRQDAEARLSELMGFDVKLDTAFLQRKNAISPRAFLFRLLNNLKQIYLATSDVQSALRIIRFMRVTDPQQAVEVRDEGLCCFALERYTEAAACLRQYLKMVPDAFDAAMISILLYKIQSKVAASMDRLLQRQRRQEEQRRKQLSWNLRQLERQMQRQAQLTPLQHEQEMLRELRRRKQLQQQQLKQQKQAQQLQPDAPWPLPDNLSYDPWGEPD